MPTESNNPNIKLEKWTYDLNNNQKVIQVKKDLKIEKGLTKDQIIDQMINGKPADEIVMEALAIRNKQHRRSNKPTIIMLSALLFLFIVIFFLIKSGRLDKKEE